MSERQRSDLEKLSVQCGASSTLGNIPCDGVPTGCGVRSIWITLNPALKPRWQRSWWSFVCKTYSGRWSASQALLQCSHHKRFGFLYVNMMGIMILPEWHCIVDTKQWRLCCGAGNPMKYSMPAHTKPRNSLWKPMKFTKQSLGVFILIALIEL